jgi:hypothetical protein
MFIRYLVTSSLFPWPLNPLFGVVGAGRTSSHSCTTAWLHSCSTIYLTPTWGLMASSCRLSIFCRFGTSVVLCWGQAQSPWFQHSSPYRSHHWFCCLRPRSLAWWDSPHQGHLTIGWVFVLLSKHWALARVPHLGVPGLRSCFAPLTILGIGTWFPSCRSYGKIQPPRSSTWWSQLAANLWSQCGHDF